jgi:hypothetical protein
MVSVDVFHELVTVFSTVSDTPAPIFGSESTPENESDSRPAVLDPITIESDSMELGSDKRFPMADIHSV